MSQTVSIHFRNRSFWAWDVVSSTFLKFMIDAATTAYPNADPWLAETIQNWKVNAIIPDLGFFLNDQWSQSQINTVVGICQTATDVVRSRQVIPAAEIDSEPVIDGLHIFMRGLDSISGLSIAQFGDAVIALLTDTLPPAPPNHRWFYSLEMGAGTVSMCSDA